MNLIIRSSRTTSQERQSIKNTHLYKLDVSVAAVVTVVVAVAVVAAAGQGVSVVEGW
jgi:uncharacterized membrane protein